MEGSEGVLTISSLFQNRRPALEQLIAFIKQLQRADKEGSLAQRIWLLNSIAKFVFTSTRLWIEALSKFKYEICYEPLHATAKRAPRRRSTTANKDRRRPELVRQQEMTIDEILADSVQMTLQQNGSALKVTPRREPVSPAAVATGPALQPEAISIHVLEESAASNKSFQLHNAAEEKMMTYHKLLAGNREELNVTAPPTLSSTRKRRTSTKRKTSAARDEDIYLDEGPIRQQNLEKLTTKVRRARELKEHLSDTFDNRLKQLNPVLSNIGELRTKLVEKLSRRQAATNENETYNQESQNQSFLQNNSLEEKFIINELNNPTVTALLQSKLTNILQGALFMEPVIGFRQFCSKRKITREIKGELFYQLLHMDFPLEQSNPAEFGDIFINPK